MNCRHCQAPVTLTLADLGSAPPSNAYLTPEQLKAPEKWYPLRVLVCERCWLAQTEDFAQADELFGADYAYFSSFSTTWLTHAQRFVGAMTERFHLTPSSHVVEVASNDGYLLQYVAARGIPCLGIEPTKSTATAARSKGISVLEDFFGTRLARELAAQGRQADLIVANNVLAHVPDVNDFVAGFALLLKRDGVATFEFPHLLRLIAETQFDTIYHEHFSYLSLGTVERIFAANGLAVFGVEELPTHGGSLRVFAQRADAGCRPRDAKVERLLQLEADAGMRTPGYYAGFQQRIERVKDDFLEFVLTTKRAGHAVAAYGAAAKGNTFLNFAGVRSDLVRFVADRNPAKQKKFMPGSRIPIVDEARLRHDRPRYVIVLPWNLKYEVMEQLAYIRSWGGEFVSAIPRLENR
jgi:2-polyprenyl-3-methyl-5-hydroxy-6-metoxy-1,4-benzoquinol methylase